MPAPVAVRLFRLLVPLVVLLLCATRNLPWRLADYDQAKQAFVSLEIVAGENPFFQRTPNAAKLATKPPLVGWLSVGIHQIPGLGKWELAWRLPSILATAALAVALWRAGRAVWPAGGGWLAAGAFGLNLLTPRLATLARTDMVLALCVTGAGLLIWRQRRENHRPWSTGERWALAGLLTAGTMTKGPVVYAFLLPGLCALFLWERRHTGWLLSSQGDGAIPAPLLAADQPPEIPGAVPAHQRREGSRRPPGRWSALWPWLLPFAVFAVWVVAGCLTQPRFYEQVVGREFLGRFDYSARAYHASQPVWYYVAGLLGRWVPWSLFLLGTVFLVRPAWRATLRDDPAGRWLACWAAGGLVLMSLVPSKRTDRIFPVVPPLCLLLATVVGHASRRTAGAPSGVERWAGWTTAAALVVAVTATGYEVRKSFRRHEDSLDRFGRHVRQLASARGWRCELATGGHVEESDETLLVCLRRRSWLNNAAAAAAWRDGRVDALVLQTTTLKELGSALGGEGTGFTVAARMDAARRQDVPYLLVLRPGAVGTSP